ARARPGPRGAPGPRPPPARARLTARARHRPSAAALAAATPENNLSISISATYRPVERAHLMHYCYKVHHGTTTPAAVKTAYDIAYAPALSSRARPPPV